MYLSASLECTQELGRRYRAKRDDAVEVATNVPAPYAEVLPLPVPTPLVGHRVMGCLSQPPDVGRASNRSLDGQGVENAGQVKRLREAGRDFGQGYLYAKPAPGVDVPTLIREWVPPEEVGLRQSLKRLIRP